jgi:hypothetical protein
MLFGKRNKENSAIHVDRNYISLLRSCLYNYGSTHGLLYPGSLHCSNVCVIGIINRFLIYMYCR